MASNEFFDTEVLSVIPEGMTELEYYRRNALTGIPNEMAAWRLGLDRLPRTKFGKYVVTEIRPAPVESSHRIRVVDEAGRPLEGIGVAVLWPSNKDPIDPGVQVNYWYFGYPKVLQGNYVFTGPDGVAWHTYGATGGENICIVDVEAGQLLLSSDIVTNCTWVGADKAKFRHTGVDIEFQRRKVGEMPPHVAAQEDRLRLGQVEVRLARLEAEMADLKRTFSVR